MSDSPANSLFITDEVRDYISVLYQLRVKEGKDVSTSAMTYSLYSNLAAFMNKIAEYDTIDKRNTLKNYLVNVICTRDETHTPELKQHKIDSFIKMIETDTNKSSPENVKLLTAMKEIKTNLPKMLSDNTPVDECKKKITETIGKYFELSTQLTLSDIKKHNDIRSLLTNLTIASPDVILFLNFFNFVKCTGTTDCTNYTKLTTGDGITNTDSRLNLLKENEEIILLNLFKGKNTVVIINKKEQTKMQQLKQYFMDNIMLSVSAITALIVSIYAYKLINGGQNNKYKHGGMTGGISIVKMTASIIIIGAVVTYLIKDVLNIDELYEKLITAGTLMNTAAVVTLIAALGMAVINFSSALDNIGDQINAIKNNNPKISMDFIKETLKWIKENGEKVISTITTKLTVVFTNIMDLFKTTENILKEEAKMYGLEYNNNDSEADITASKKYTVTVADEEKFYNFLTDATSKPEKNAKFIIFFDNNRDNIVINDKNKKFKKDDNKTIGELMDIIIKYNDITEETVVTSAVLHDDTVGSPPPPNITEKLRLNSTRPAIIQDNSNSLVQTVHDTSLSSAAAATGEEEGSRGGASVECLKIHNLKQNMLSRLVKFAQDEVGFNYETSKESCEGDDYDFNGKAYIIDDSKIITSVVDVSSKKANCDGPSLQSKMDKLLCLRATNLARRKKINSDTSKVWNNINKNLNTPNLSIGPNMFQILKGSNFPSNMNYQLGGADVDETENYNFIKTKNNDVKIQYSYQIITLLKKALLRLNNNGVYLEANTIKEIQNKIDSLKSAEASLAEYSENIVNASKISQARSEKGLALDEKQLQGYVENYKKMSQSADRTAIKLNTVLLKLAELVDNRGEEILKLIEDSLNKK